MIDIDSLLQGASITHHLSTYVFEPAHLTNGEFKSYLQDNKNVDASICSAAISYIYDTDILDIELFDLLFKQSHIGEVEHPIAKALNDLNRYYKLNELDVAKFNEHMSSLDPSKGLAKYVTQLIWDDKTLSIEVTGSANIDPHNDPEYVVLAVSLWWPHLTSELMALSTVYSNSELANVFLNDISNKEPDNYNQLVEQLFI